MNQKIFNYTIGVVFIIIALVHLVRSILGFDISLDGFIIPSGVSVVAFLVATFISYTAFTLNKK